MGNLEEQKEELEVLQSIFGDEVLVVNELTFEGQFLAEPALQHPLTVFSHPEGGVKQELEVNFLPPIVLHFSLPRDYPSSRSPTFVLSCQWLTKAQLSTLCHQLDSLWLECRPEVVLFRWVQFLQEDALTYLDVQPSLDITSLVTATATGKINPAGLAQALKQMVTISDGKESDKVLPEPEASCRIGNLNSRAAQRMKSPIEIVNAHLSKGHVEPEALERGRGKQARHNDHGGHKHAMPVKKVLNDEEVLKSLNINATVTIAERTEVNSEDPRAVVDLKRHAAPLPILVEYNELKQKESFKKEWFSCKVCLCQKQGTQCLQFVNCHHVYCKLCMQIYFEVQIKEGNVRLLTCPEEKCSSQATPAQVYELVSSELYERYDKMLLESSLATMGDLTYCPRTSCQFVVIKDHSENHATCERCLFVFCHMCRRTYHGLAPCRMRPEEKVQMVRDYQSGCETIRRELEKRFGKKHLLQMIDEALSEKWLSDCTKKCPRCAASIQKIDGCNKMVCWRCNTYFCWLCMMKLNEGSPYLHFNDPGSKCFNLLFEGAQNDGMEGDDWEFGQFI